MINLCTQVLAETQVFLEKSVDVNRNCLFKDLSVLEGVCELKLAEITIRGGAWNRGRDWNRIDQSAGTGSGDGFAELTRPKETSINFGR